MIIEIEAEYQSDAGTTKDTPYLDLTGELWGVFCEYLSENQPRYNGTALYLFLLCCVLLWLDYHSQQLYLLILLHVTFLTKRQS